MKELLLHPRRNAAILGLLQGVPQGLMLDEQQLLVARGFDDANFPLLVGFGLFAPPVLATFSHFANGRKTPKFWTAITRYVDPLLMIVWGCLALGILGAFTLRRNGAAEGYSVCAFFVAGAAGFLVSWFIDGWLSRRAAHAT